MKEINKKIIGVLGRPGVDTEEDSYVAMYNGVKSAIIKKDCIPFMIPPLLDIDYASTPSKDIPKLTEQEKSLYRSMVDLCDGILMPGGYRLYEYDKYVVEYAIEKDIPVLGICMGMQLLSMIDNNGKFIEKNETTINHSVRKKDYVHKVTIVDGTMLKNILKKEEIRVNSKHNYHVTKVNQYVVSAYSEDGLIEAIENPDKKFVIGVQWHPEKMLDYDEDANKILDEFIKNM